MIGRGARALLRDERGHMVSELLGLSLTWFVTFAVFLMNVQLAQLFYRRDVVDHAGGVAADTAKKTYCAMEENSSAAEREIHRAIDPLLETASAVADCKVSVRPQGEAEDPGAKALEVTVACSFKCNIPFAAPFMCNDGKRKFEAKVATVALGCDGKGS
jgi:hypothetical protein